MFIQIKCTITTSCLRLVRKWQQGLRRDKELWLQRHSELFDVQPFAGVLWRVDRKWGSPEEPPALKDDNLDNTLSSIFWTQQLLVFHPPDCAASNLSGYFWQRRRKKNQTNWTLRMIEAGCDTGGNRPAEWLTGMCQPNPLAGESPGRGRGRWRVVH